MIEEGPRFPREYFRPLLPCLLEFISPANSQIQEEQCERKPSDRPTQRTKSWRAIRPYASRTERRTSATRPSLEIAGREKAPSARSTSRTTEMVRRATRISVGGLRGCRAPLAMATALWASPPISSRRST